MRAVDMDILSRERCEEQSLRTNLEVNDVEGIICGTPKKEINNVCETDIGSPLACQNENGFYELAGIYSRDTGFLPTNQIAVFAPLDVSWLKRVTFESPSEEKQTRRTTKNLLQRITGRALCRRITNIYLQIENESIDTFYSQLLLQYII